jgi:SSS family solute:Na+ symporter
MREDNDDQSGRQISQPHYVSSPTASHWVGSSDIVFGHSIYIGLTAVILNLVITVVMTLILKAAKAPEGADETLPHQYTADSAPAPVPTPAGVGLRGGSE